LLTVSDFEATEGADRSRDALPGPLIEIDHYGDRLLGPLETPSARGSPDRIKPQRHFRPQSYLKLTNLTVNVVSAKMISALTVEVVSAKNDQHTLYLPSSSAGKTLLALA
jgi:hypothetical protein